MQRWQESGKRREKIKEERKERLIGKKMQARGKVAKSRNTTFSWFVGQEGRQVGSLKRRVQSIIHQTRGEINWTQLWCEKYFQVKSVTN